MKLKKIFLSFVLMMSMLCVVACKDKGKDPESGNSSKTQVDSVVNPSVADRVYLVGEKLEDIELLLAMGDTVGLIAWDDEDYVLVQGENSCAWTFLPTDAESFKSKTGSLKINAVKLENPVVSDVEVVPGQTIYIEQKYALINLQGTATFGGETVAGTFVWKEPTKTFVEGENVCEWKFVPTDGTKYAVVEGEITVTATVQQTPTSLAVVNNTKTQYAAFDTIDLSTLTLHLGYDGGKTEVLEFDSNDVSITYLTEETPKSLRRGDTKATITYLAYGLRADIVLDETDYKLVQVPVFDQTHVYSGQPKLLTFSENADSGLYTFVPRTETNAGDYDIVVTLEDDDNYKWANGDETSTTVTCTIHKADLASNKTNYTGEFDGQAHSVSVSNHLGTTVYYSETELDETNYAESSTELIKKTNAGEYTIYYYMVGDSNHNAGVGTLNISISKQTPTIDLRYCYTLKTNDIVNYPTSYVTITDKQNAVVEPGDLVKTYYSVYSDDENPQNDILTSSADGAISPGTAPKNDKTTEYFVVVEFVGNQNYNAVSAHTVLFIDGVGQPLYAGAGEDAFAFKYEPAGYYGSSSPYDDDEQVLVGSHAECNYYIEFNALDLDSNGLKVVEFYSKFGIGEASKKDGYLVFVDGEYILLCEDGSYYTYSQNTETDELTIVINELGSSQPQTAVLQKWELPKYLGTYSAQTVSDADYDESNHTSKNTDITFYNDYGTIRFIVNVNVKYISSATGTSGGSTQWIGVAETSIGPAEDAETSHRLTCYVTGLDSGYYQNSSNKVEISWKSPANVYALDLDPDSIKLYEGASSLLNGFADVKNVEYVKVS